MLLYSTTHSDVHECPFCGGTGLQESNHGTRVCRECGGTGELVCETDGEGFDTLAEMEAEERYYEGKYGSDR